MAENKDREYAAMIVAGQMAVRIDENTPRHSGNIARKPEQIRAELLEQYKLCYDAIIEMHKPRGLAAHVPGVGVSPKQS